MGSTRRRWVSLIAGLFLLISAIAAPGIMAEEASVHQYSEVHAGPGGEWDAVQIGIAESQDGASKSTAIGIGVSTAKNDSTSLRQASTFASNNSCATSYSTVNSWDGSHASASQNARADGDSSAVTITSSSAGNNSEAHAESHAEATGGSDAVSIAVASANNDSYADASAENGIAVAGARDGSSASVHVTEGIGMAIARNGGSTSCQVDGSEGRPGGMFSTDGSGSTCVALSTAGTRSRR